MRGGRSECGTCEAFHPRETDDTVAGRVEGQDRREKRVGPIGGAEVERDQTRARTAGRQRRTPPAGVARQGSGRLNSRAYPMERRGHP